MSEGPVTPAETRAERVVRLLAKKPMQPCPVCSSNRWTLAFAHIEPPATPFASIRDVSDRTVKGAFNCTMLYCIVCGHLRWQDGPTFEKYLQTIETGAA